MRQMDPFKVAKMIGRRKLQINVACTKRKVNNKSKLLLNMMCIHTKSHWDRTEILKSKYNWKHCFKKKKMQTQSQNHSNEI